MTYKPTRAMIEIGLDSMIVGILSDMDYEKRNQRLAEMKNAIEFFKDRGYNLSNYMGIYRELRDEFADDDVLRTEDIEKWKCTRKEIVDDNRGNYSKEMRCLNCDGYGIYEERGKERHCSLFTVLLTHARMKLNKRKEEKNGI